MIHSLLFLLLSKFPKGFLASGTSLIDFDDEVPSAINTSDLAPHENKGNAVNTNISLSLNNGTANASGSKLYSKLKEFLEVQKRIWFNWEFYLIDLALFSWGWLIYSLVTEL